jgi:putative adenylate-forming enzyme
MKGKILYYWLRFRLATRFKSRQQLEAYQQRRLRDFFQHVLIHSPLYAPLVKAQTPLSHFPVVNKAVFMEKFDEINTCGVPKEKAMQLALQAEESRNFSPEYGNLTVGLSTGTSGKRGLFVVSENERAQWVALVMTRVIRPVFFRKQKIAFFLRANSNLYSSIGSSLFEFRYFDIFKPIDELLTQLTDYQPDIIAAQPSILSEIADRQEKNQLQLKPRQLISFAEVLPPEDAAYISSVFQLPLTEVYQCTEGFLGVSCAHGTIHLNEDFVHVEKKYIDARRFHPILTDFTRTTQPIVRYELDDILVERESPCPCGSVFTGLERIEGRADDVLLFGENPVIKIYPDLISRMIARRTNDFRAYRLVQETKDRICIELDCEASQLEQVGQQFRACVTELLTTKNVHNVEVRIQPGVTFVRGNKFRKITRLFK